MFIATNSGFDISSVGAKCFHVLPKPFRSYGAFELFLKRRFYKHYVPNGTSCQ
jgi:hypothetical protein